MFFKYANRVAAEKKTMPADLKITDEVLKSFEAFLKEREFNYEEDAEAKVKELREVAQKSRYGPAFLEGLDRLSKDVEKEKARGFERYDKEIRRALRLELFNRLKGEKAAIEASLKDDTQLQVALALVRSKTLYQSLLKPSKR